MKRVRWLAIVILCLGLLFIWVVKRQPVELEPFAEERVLHSVTVENQLFKLVDDGKVYRVDPHSNKWILEAVVLQPEIIAKSYQKEGNVTYRVSQEDDKRYPVLREFHCDFDAVPTGHRGLRELIGVKHGFTEFTLQTPRHPSVREYVKHRQEMLQGNGDFDDAYLAPTIAQAKSGKQSLKCVCPAKTSSMICSKCSLTTALVYFTEGDDVWYEAWYYVEGDTTPLTLVDLESDLVESSPGIRIMLYESALGVELKALEKPKFRQKTDKPIRFPNNRWVKITWHLHLRGDSTGKIRLWQDDQLLVDTNGQTLPYAKAIYNSLEVGISAHVSTDSVCTMYVDDLHITTKSLK